MTEGDLIWWHRATAHDVQKVPAVFIAPAETGPTRAYVAARRFSWKAPELMFVNVENLSPRDRSERVPEY